MTDKNQTAADIQAAEKAQDERRFKRGRAFRTIELRDQGWAKLKDYNGSEVVMFWHSPEELEDGEVRKQVSPEKFLLLAHGKILAFDTEEFRKVLRWA